MRIDAASSVPVFLQIVDGISAAIAAGVYKPGELISSVRQQALALLVNPNTVQRAYEHLEREGLLVSKRGSGMAVAPDARSIALLRTADAVRTTFAQGIRAADSANLSRKKIDSLYRTAWNDSQLPDRARDPKVAYE